MARAIQAGRRGDFSFIASEVVRVSGERVKINEMRASLAVLAIFAF